MLWCARSDGSLPLRREPAVDLPVCDLQDLLATATARITTGGDHWRDRLAPPELVAL